MPKSEQSVPHSVVSDLISSFLTQITVLTGNLVALRLAAAIMGPAGVGEFALVRRLVVFLSPLALLGLGVGLPRTLARQAQRMESRSAVIVAAWLLGLLGLGLVVGVCALFSAPVSHLLFGAGESRLLLPTLALVAANQLFVLNYGALRGELRIRSANGLQIVLIAVLPSVCVAVLGHRGAGDALLGLGWATIAVAPLFTLIGFRHVLPHARAGELRSAARELLAYSCPRVPGDLALTSLYAIGPILAAHTLDLGAAGMLALGVNLITVFSAGFAPLGLVLLPRLSRSFGRNGHAAQLPQLSMLASMSTYGSCFLVVAGCVYGNRWVEVVLGPEYRFDPLCLVLLVAAAGSNIVFVILRSVLDAAIDRPVNSRHTFISLCVLVITWFVLQGVHAGAPLVRVCVAIAFSFLALGALTLLALWRNLGLRPRPIQVLRWAGVQGTLGAVGLFLSAHTAGVLFVVGQVALLAAWLLALRVTGVTWPAELCRLLRRRGTRAGMQTSAPFPGAIPVLEPAVMTAPSRPGPEAIALARSDDEV